MYRWRGTEPTWPTHYSRTAPYIAPYPMDAYITDAERAFRDEVRSFIRDHLPLELAARSRAQTHLSREDVTRWHRVLHSRGWSVPSWPAEYGGPGWSATQRYIFEDECARADAPPLSTIAISMMGPVMYTFGTDAQKARYLPGIASGEEAWCQGFSEPGAGSDLAALRTRAVRSPDATHYVVNGSKIWTTDAHKADMMFCLVRTDLEAKQQRGISFLLLDMRSVGVTVRPLISIDAGHSLNEVFLDNVQVPCENLIGEENKGWNYAKFLLGHERAAIAEVSRTKRRFAILLEIAQNEFSNGAPLLQEAGFAARVAEVEIELQALELANFRLLVRGAASDAMAAASMMKLRGSEVLQKVSELALDALGPSALPYAPGADGSHGSLFTAAHAAGRVEDYLFRRAATLYAGSSETQRNILAKNIFSH